MIPNAIIRKVAKEYLRNCDVLAWAKKTAGFSRLRPWKTNSHRNSSVRWLRSSETMKTQSVKAER